MDVVTAFLKGTLEDEIYMEQPGYAKPGENYLVCKLNKFIYELKQASKCWNMEFKRFMNEIGFNEHTSDPRVFTKIDNNISIIAVNVDDFICLTEGQKEVINVKKKLKNGFKINDMGELHYCLGISITMNNQKKSIGIHQHQYIMSLLERLSMESAYSVAIPADPNVKLENDNESPVDQKSYQSLVGSLLYTAMVTRPDIAQAVATISKFNSNHHMLI